MNKSTVDPKIFDLFEFRPRKGDLKKLEIVKAAIECLASVGIENTTYEAIAQKLNTRRAHIAYHFSDKNDIFMAAIKYILATSQQLTIDNIAKAETGKEMLTSYIEAYFTWAKQYPDQLAVMLLFYYLALLKTEYRELNDQIRKSGQERLVYIINNKISKKISNTDATRIAKDIQYLITGAMIDAATTKDKTLLQSKNEVVRLAYGFLSL